MAGTTVRDLDTYVAGADLSAKQFHIVKASAVDGKAGIVAAAAATDELLGINMDKPLSGEAAGVAAVTKGGICPVAYGGTVTVGAKLTSDAAGKAIVTVTAGNKSIGIARIAGVAGDIGEVMLGAGPDILP